MHKYNNIESIIVLLKNMNVIWEKNIVTSKKYESSFST